MTTGIGVDKASEITPRDFERMLLRTLTAIKKGDFTARMPVEFTGSAGKIADTLNEFIDIQERIKPLYSRFPALKTQHRSENGHHQYRKNCGGN